MNFPTHPQTHLPRRRFLRGTRRHARTSDARVHDTGLLPCCGIANASQAHAAHLQQPRGAAPALFPEGQRRGLHALALFEGTRGISKATSPSLAVCRIPAVTGGHSTENCFLTAARDPTRSGFRNSISLDQFAAEKLGQQTRFSTLNLGVNIDKANRSLSWTRDGVLLPAEDSPAALFRKMFLQGDANDVAA
jgi:hypothetical protein